MKIANRKLIKVKESAETAKSFATRDSWGRKEAQIPIFKLKIFHTNTLR